MTPDSREAGGEGERGLLALLGRRLATGRLGLRRGGPAPRRFRRLALLAAFVLYVGAIAVALDRLPPLELHPGWLALLLLVSPAVLFLNSLEFILAARVVDVRASLPEAVHVSLLASSTNLLPIPGAVLVRSWALVRKGGEVRAAARATLAVGIAWLAASLLLSVIAFVSLGQPIWGLALLVGGLAAAGWTFRLAGPDGSGRSLVVRMLLLEVVFVLLAALRLYLAFRGLGMSASVEQALGIVLSGPVAAAAGVFPAGLGLKELLAGAVGALLGIGAADSVLATAVDRMAGLIVLGVVTALWVVRFGHGPVPARDRTGGEGERP